MEMGAQLDARDIHGCTPVFVACSDGMAAGLSSLLAAGANMHLRNAAGESPLCVPGPLLLPAVPELRPC